MFDFFEDARVSRIFDLVIVFLLLVIIGFNVFRLEKEYQEEKVNSYVTDLEPSEVAVSVEEKVEENTLEPVLKKYFVDIKGAVKNAGVYEVLEGSIINDVVTLAGGLKSNANTKYLNLSKKVSDEMVINIYTDTEIKKMTDKEVVEVVKECVCETENTLQCEGASVIETNDNSSNNEDVDDKVSSSNNNQIVDQNNNQNNSTKININTATLDELMTLNGVGEAKAKAIIEYRTNNNGFKTIEEIKNVSGIGDAAYNKIKDNITI